METFPNLKFKSKEGKLAQPHSSLFFNWANDLQVWKQALIRKKDHASLIKKIKKIFLFVLLLHNGFKSFLKQQHKDRPLSSEVFVNCFSFLEVRLG